MKTIVKLVILFSFHGLFFSNTKAQDYFDGVIKTFPELDKYVGTWQWTSGDSLFTVTLVKTQFNLKKSDPNAPDATTEVIIGWHEFKLKDRIIESSNKSKSSEYDYKNNSFTIHGTCLYKDGACDRLSINSFYDMSAKRFRAGYLKIKENEPDLAVMVLFEKQWFEKTQPPKRTFPNKFLLKKIK